jgi:hypothetical protein
MTIFYCLRFETPQKWWARSPYLYPPGIEWSGYTPRHWLPFLSPPITCRAMVEVFKPASIWGLTHNGHLAPYIASAQTAKRTPLTTARLLLPHIAINTDCVENTASQLLHCCMFFSCCLATDKFAELFPSNICLCWLHNSGFRQTYHNIYIYTRTHAHKKKCKYCELCLGLHWRWLNNVLP